jgi:hypothetical protein
MLVDPRSQRAERNSMEVAVLQIGNVVLIDIGISFEIQENSEILLLNATIT